MSFTQSGRTLFPIEETHRLVLNEQDEGNSGSDFRRRQSDSSGIQPPIFVAIMLLFVILYPSLVDNSNHLTDLGDGPNDPDPPLKNNSTNPIEPIEPNEPGENTSNNTNSTNPHIPSENDTDGDGWTDILEILCGSNGNDSNSVPLDLDANGLCDEVTTPTWLPGPGEENDTDGDGWADWREEKCGSDLNNSTSTPIIENDLMNSSYPDSLSEWGIGDISQYMEFTERLVNRSSMIGLPVFGPYFHQIETQLEKYNNSPYLKINILSNLDKDDQFCSYGNPENIYTSEYNEHWTIEGNLSFSDPPVFFQWHYYSKNIYDAESIIDRLISSRERGEIVAFWIFPKENQSNEGSNPTNNPNDE